MSMEVKPKIFFTAYDEKITGSSQRDPLGLQPIWSYLGGRVIKHLTTVSTDIRGFREALLCLSICFECQSDCDRNLRDLIIIFEQLFIYTCIKKGKTDFILGSDNGKRRFDSSNQNPTISENDTILANQITLGYYGRYKTPLRSMKIIDEHSRILIDMEKVKELYSTDLYNKLLTDFKRYIKKGYKSFKDFSGNEGLFDAVCGKFRNGEKEFWLEHLQICGKNENELMKLCYNELYNDTSLSARDLFEKREFANYSEVEAILNTEPFLCCIDEIFYSLLNHSNLSSIDFDSGIHANSFELLKRVVFSDSTGLAKRRFSHIKSKLNPQSNNYVTEIYNYHVAVCKQKNKAQWLETDNENIRAFVHDETTVKPNIWRRDYYTSSLKSIINSIKQFQSENDTEVTNNEGKENS